MGIPRWREDTPRNSGATPAPKAAHKSSVPGATSATSCRVCCPRAGQSVAASPQCQQIHPKLIPSCVSFPSNSFFSSALPLPSSSLGQIKDPSAKLWVQIFFCWRNPNRTGMLHGLREGRISRADPPLPPLHGFKEIKSWRLLCTGWEAE